jgi:ABC-type multidrug transport system fused ATPase/permease subunit
MALLLEAFGHFKSKFVIMVVLGFLGGLFGGIGIGAIIPLFSVITHQQIQGMDFITKNVEKVFALFRIPLTLPFLLSFIVILYVLKGFVQFIAKYTNEKIMAQYEAQARTNLLRVTIQSSWPHLISQKVGYLERVLLGDITEATSVLDQISGIILIATSLIMYTFVAINISFDITLMTLILGAIIFLFIKPFLYKTRKIISKTSAMNKVASHYINESIMGAKMIKITSIENKIADKGKEYFEELRKTRVKSAFYWLLLGTFFEPLGLLFVAVLFVFSFKSPGFNIAAFTVTVYLIQRMFSFIQSVQGQVYTLNNQSIYLKIISDYKRNATNNLEVNRESGNFIFNESLEFKNVQFAYPSHKEVLKNINFSIKNGEVMGIIGPSGAGKTTIVDLVLRLFTPGAGKILLDGKDIDGISLKEWKKNIGYVPQDNFFLSDTVENNIRFYDESISEEDIIEASKIANIYDTIQSMPEKFKTFMGERGIQLSGGQRQRIALARALARKPQILILDEATSSLDNESEALIQKAISDLRGKTTIIIVAHRLSTVMNSGHIIVLKNGVIIESGSPDELLQNENSYFHKIRNMVNDNFS